MELNEKLKVDNKKKVDQIEKLQRDIRYMEDRVRNLEIKGEWGNSKVTEGYTLHGGQSPKSGNQR